jgi:deazaflavin-dependent oxidoreductase (nitroreductase family)
LTAAAARDSRRRSLPRWVPYFNAVARPLLAIGVPMGPDVLITVRGRKSGRPRTTPITICENAGRRGLISPFGETDWVRNLRVAGRATVGIGQRREEVTAIELEPVAAAAFISDVLAPHARRSWLGDWFVRNVDKLDYDDPVNAVIGRPVFEIFPTATPPTSESSS